VNEDAMDGSEWVGVVTGDDGEPVIQNRTDPAPGFYVSTTSLEDPRQAVTNPSRYVDATKIPYICHPGRRLGDIILTASSPLKWPVTLAQIDAAVDAAFSKFSVHEFLTLVIAQCRESFHNQLSA
jgi:hypothetical protein